MWHENVIFFPFQSYQALRSIPIKDKKDQYFYKELRRCFFHHKPLPYTLEYIEDADELHYINVLVGDELVEIVTFVSRVFREVFKAEDHDDMGVEIISLSDWFKNPFTRSFVELPVPVLDVSVAIKYLNTYQEYVFPDWVEGFTTREMGGTLYQGSLGDDFSEPIYIPLERIVVKGYTKEMLHEVMGKPLYDLMDLSQTEMTFLTTTEGRRQWELKFPEG